jgi:hypothetical protein
LGNDHSFVKFAFADAKITPAAIASPIGRLDKKTINGPAAKEVFHILFG